jgi:Tfp pilus assembly protein PilO
MKKGINRVETDVTRRLRDRSFSLRIYSIWAVVAFVVFGLGGIYPQIKVLREGVNTYKEMKEINNSLVSKINLISSEYIKIESSKEEIIKLDKALPADYEIQNYIVDLSFAVAKAGYSLVAFNAQKLTETDTSVKASATLEGKGSVGELIKSIESLDRAAQINGFKLTEQAGERNIVFTLDLYILE